jgi:site-specific recombinase XerD
MTKHPVSPLRQRLIDDMTIRNMSPNTIKIYVYAVAKVAAFHGRSPDKLTVEDVRAYRLHLISLGYQPTSINPIMGALRFFYGATLGRKDVVEEIPYARRADKLPAVLTGDDVARFLKAVSDFNMRTIFITIYAAGLRVSEAVALTAKDIDSARMVIVVRQGKGRKDRCVMLSEQLLAILRDYWRRTRPRQCMP